jgi:hypothetical protein
VKEELCYVSDNVLEELAPGKGRSRTSNSNNMLDPMGGKLKKNFVLPDFNTVFKGYTKGDNEPITREEQVILNAILHLAIVSDIFFQTLISCC